MRRISFNSENGAILLVVIILMLALTITGLAFLSAGVMENSLVRREIHKNQAFYLAEAGLERTLWNLKQDFEKDQDWTDGDINGTLVVSPEPNWTDDQKGDFYSLPLLDPTLDGGEYSAELRYVFTGPGTEAEKDEIWVKSTGTVEEDISKTVQVYVKIGNLSPWNNAIFAGAGATGGAINGNTRIHGSVHILGTGLGSDDLAMDMTGDAGIRNNYKDMPLELTERVPECPTTSFNGEVVESLGATLRVKQGKVGLDSAAAKVGQPDALGDSLNLKETVDGAYVTDGYGGSHGEENVHSDNGTGNAYDLGDTVVFPSLSHPYVDPVTGQEQGFTYLEYLEDNSLHITGINEISSNVDSFAWDGSGYHESLGDVNLNDQNYITWDKDNGLLTINGIIYIEGSLLLDLSRAHETIEYSGKGTIVVASAGGEGIVGDIRVHGNLLAEGTPDTGGGFPNNVLGLVAGSLYLATGAGESLLTMTGAFFAENEIVSQKQNEIGGTFVSNYFNIEQNVPRIYEVPDLATRLPQGMPGGPPDWYIITSQWSEL